MAYEEYTKLPEGWYIESGATDHMCCDRTTFADYQPLATPRPVYLGDSSRGDAHGIGAVRLGNGITLTGVLHVPSLELNLFSVAKALRRRYEIAFTPAGCTIRRDGRDVMAAIRCGNLFRIETWPALANLEHGNVSTGETTPPESQSITRTLAMPANDDIHSETLRLWHQRLGHLNLADLRRLAGMANGLLLASAWKSASPEVCPACIEGKQHQIFNRWVPASRAEAPLALLHSDPCGPFRTASIAGEKYFVLFVDDYTRMTWVHFLRTKGHQEVLGAFQEFKAAVEKHSGRSILRLRCDNGRGEYTNQFFLYYLRTERINHEPSAPYTQHQNGVSERKIPSIVEKARPMLLEAQLPPRFWAEAVNTAVYLLNRSPTKALNTTPFEAWHGRPEPSSPLRMRRLSPRARRPALATRLEDTAVRTPRVRSQHREALATLGRAAAESGEWGLCSFRRGRIWGQDVGGDPRASRGGLGRGVRSWRSQWEHAGRIWGVSRKGNASGWHTLSAGGCGERRG